jgi:hypothetical protein
VKTDAIDLEAITELVLTGQATPVTERAEVIGELTAWVRHRSRRVEARSALKNQLLGQLDRAFPGLTIALPDVLGTKVGRMVAEHFADPARLASLGESRFIRFAATRGSDEWRHVSSRLHEKHHPPGMPTRRDRLWPTTYRCLGRSTSRSLTPKSTSVRCLPETPFAVLTSVPGWASVSASAYGAAVGDPGRWPGPRQIYRAWVCHRCSTSRPARPRWCNQPGRQRRAASRPDRPRRRTVAQRPGGQGLRPLDARSREEGRRDRMRDGEPGQPDRVRPGPRPDRLRPPAGPDHTPGSSSIAAHAPRCRRCPRAAPAAQRGRTTLTATNRGAPCPSEEEPNEPLRHPSRGSTGHPSQPDHPVRSCRQEGPDQTPNRLWRTLHA